MDIMDREKRLLRFYGDVARSQNESIIRLITGSSVLDVGCGYGNLLRQIRSELPGVKVAGIDPDAESAGIARKMYGIDVMPMSACKMSFADGSFDTVILREAIHHFDAPGMLQSAMREISRVCSKEVIVFDPNPSWLVRASRRIIKHVDPEAPSAVTIKALEDSGFDIVRCDFRDVIAFPLSGGFVGKELVPNVRAVKHAVMALDSILNSALRLLRLQSHFCWRYIVYAKKKG